MPLYSDAKWRRIILGCHLVTERSEWHHIRERLWWYCQARGGSIVFGTGIHAALFADVGPSGRARVSLSASPCKRPRRG